MVIEKHKNFLDGTWEIFKMVYVKKSSTFALIICWMCKSFYVVSFEYDPIETNIFISCNRGAVIKVCFLFEFL